MSFRTRLTFLYAMITGGMLLIFGILIYFLIDTIISQQINATLEDTYQTTLPATSRWIQAGGSCSSQLPTDSIDAHVYVQVWDTEGKLSSASSEHWWLTEPLDPANLDARQQAFGEISLDKVSHARADQPAEGGGPSARSRAGRDAALVIPDLVKRPC